MSEELLRFQLQPRDAKTDGPRGFIKTFGRSKSGVEENAHVTGISRSYIADHILELDGIRGIAILLVMVGHSWPRLSLLAVSGVGLFFVLSGFLITRILVSNVGKPHYFRNSSFAAPCVSGHCIT